MSDQGKINATKKLKIYNILCFLAEILLLILKVLYYIYEGIYRLIVPTKRKSVAGEIVLVYNFASVVFLWASQNIKNVDFIYLPNKIYEQTKIFLEPRYAILNTDTLSYHAIIPLNDMVGYAHAKITGAGQGIGKELAIGYASLGATVVCWDINEKNNNKTMNDIKRIGKDSVYAYQCDVANREEVFRVAEKVKKEVGDVTILVNNAGIVFIKSFLNQSVNEIARVIDVNVTAHYWTLKAFLPSMIEKNHGHIVALSSIAGFFGSSYGTVYCPSKFAVKAIMEAMSQELHTLSKGKSSIKFTTVYPALVFTEMTKKLKIRFPWLIRELLPQQAASLIIDAQRRNHKNKSIPSYWLPILKILSHLPDGALTCMLDFFDASVYPED